MAYGAMLATARGVHVAEAERAQRGQRTDCAAARVCAVIGGKAEREKEKQGWAADVGSTWR
jgi:hypothetical protein